MVVLANGLTHLGTVGKHRLARHAGWMFAAQGGRIALQGAYFILIARTLGTHGFGMFEAALAIVVIMVPFAGWGTGQLLVMRVARDHTFFPVYWGNAILTTVVTAIPLTLLTVAVGGRLVPELSVRLLLLLALAQFVFGKLAEQSVQAFQAFERMKVAALLTVVPGICRLITAFLFVEITQTPTPRGWSVLYLASTVVGAAVTLTAVTRLLGRPVLRPTLLWQSAKDGGYFSVGAAAENVYADIDKAMLARLATLTDAGIYAAAYRATFMAFTPVRSLLAAAYPRFFRSGQQGIRGSLGLATSLLPFAVAVSAAASLGLFLFAPLVPAILGSDYHASIGALRWLAVLPLLQSLDYLAGDTLSGAGYQGIRSAVQAGVIPLNVVLNLWLIPLYSWKGSAWATLASEGILVLGLWIVVGVTSRRRTGAA